MIQPYYIAETTMPGKNGFDFNGASQSFNVLASYLFGKVLDEYGVINFRCFRITVKFLLEIEG